MKPERPKLTPLQMRCRDALSMPPPYGTRLRMCGAEIIWPREVGICNAGYLDYPPGLDAHKVVFGHWPEAAA